MHIFHLHHLGDLTLYLEETVSKITRTTHHLYHPVIFSHRLFLLLLLFHLLVLIIFLLLILLCCSINQEVSILDLLFIFILHCRIQFFLPFLKVYLCLLYHHLPSSGTFHSIWDFQMVWRLFVTDIGALNTLLMLYLVWQPFL